MLQGENLSRMFAALGQTRYYGYSTLNENTKRITHAVRVVTWAMTDVNWNININDYFIVNLLHALYKVN
jgi:hypothetical protein